MISLHLKSSLTILLIINSLAYAFAQQQETTPTNCDTIILKNRVFLLVKIAEIGKDSIAFYDCLTTVFDFAKATHLRLADIETIKLAKAVSSTAKEVTYVPTKQKYYIEALWDITLPAMSFVLGGFIPKNAELSPLGSGLTFSAGYQFNRYLGLGVTTKSYTIIDESIFRTRSVLADYRLDFGKMKVSLHGGVVTSSSARATDECKIQMDGTRSSPVFALSVKRYGARYFVYGLGLSYSQIPTDEQCTSSQGIKTVRKNYINVFEAHFSIGFYAPARFKKVD